MQTGFLLAGAKLKDVIQETKHTWTTRTTSCLLCYSPVLVDIQFMEAIQSKTYQTSGVDWQPFLSDDLLLLYHSACNGVSESWHTLSDRLNSSSVAEHHFWVCQLLSGFAGVCILILMTDLTLCFSNASGFIRPNSGSRIKIRGVCFFFFE